MQRRKFIFRKRDLLRLGWVYLATSVGENEKFIGDSPTTTDILDLFTDPMRLSQDEY
jgi:hypothetical protein